MSAEELTMGGNARNTTWMILVVMFLISAEEAFVNGQSFETLKSNYPLQLTQQLATQMGLSASQYSTVDGLSCATRMTWAFIQSGHDIDRTKLRGCNWAGFTANGKNIIIRAATFKCYLDKKLGGAENAPDKESIKDKDGVIVFQGCGSWNHIDLWQGCHDNDPDDAKDDCVGTCYWDACDRATFFELNDCSDTTTTSTTTPGSTTYPDHSSSTTTYSTTSSTSTTTTTTTPDWTTTSTSEPTSTTSETTSTTTTMPSTTSTTSEPTSTTSTTTSTTTTMPPTTSTTSEPTSTTTMPPTTSTTPIPTTTTTTSTTTSTEPQGADTTPPCSQAVLTLHSTVTMSQGLQFQCSLDPSDDDYVIIIVHEDVGGGETVHVGDSLTIGYVTGTFWCEASKPQGPELMSGSTTVTA